MRQHAWQSMHGIMVACFINAGLPMFHMGPWPEQLLSLHQCWTRLLKEYCQQWTTLLALIMLFIAMLCQHHAAINFATGFVNKITVLTYRLFYINAYSPIFQRASTNNCCCFINAEQQCWNNAEQQCWNNAEQQCWNNAEQQCWNKAEQRCWNNAEQQCWNNDNWQRSFNVTACSSMIATFTGQHFNNLCDV